jgi:hypothetical protein
MKNGQPTTDNRTTKNRFPLTGFVLSVVGFPLAVVSGVFRLSVFPLKAER